MFIADDKRNDIHKSTSTVVTPFAVLFAPLSVSVSLPQQCVVRRIDSTESGRQAGSGRIEH